ncbi:MAG: hypothetical protein JSV80_01545 [Acidobacteriota bacterium]|nr:MAG: hypothetical protein JSV80_01545 [Acidobacteriota bacterium]
MSKSAESSPLFTASAWAVPLTVALAIVHIPALAPALAAGGRDVASEQTSPRLNRFTYYERGSELFLGVDTRAAQYAGQDERGAMFPLGIGLANLSDGPLYVGPESFVLEASDGRRYSAVAYEQFLRDYRRSRTDERLADTFIQTMNTRYSTFRFTPWRPFPPAGDIDVIQRNVELGHAFWTRSYLYFPLPEGGVRGRTFKLLVKPRDNEETYVVTFSVS